MGSENTFHTDLTDGAEIRAAIDDMARDVAAWLTKRGLLGRTVTLKVRYDDFTTVTRSDSQPVATSDPDAISQRAVVLLDRTEAGPRPVRLLGVSVHNSKGTEVTPRAEDPARLPFEALE